MMTPPIYWTIKQNWDGRLWPRLWPNKRFAWQEVCEETGMTKADIQRTCDWSLVPVILTEAPAKSRAR